MDRQTSLLDTDRVDRLDHLFSNTNYRLALSFRALRRRLAPARLAAVRGVEVVRPQVFLLLLGISTVPHQYQHAALDQRTSFQKSRDRHEGCPIRSHQWFRLDDRSRSRVEKKREAHLPTCFPVEKQKSSLTLAGQGQKRTLPA